MTCHLLTFRKPKVVDPAVFTCISMLARAVGPNIAQDVVQLLEPMLAVGLRYLLSAVCDRLCDRLRYLLCAVCDRLCDRLR